MRRQYGSDHYAGICPEAWRALEEANRGHAPGYGDGRLLQAEARAGGSWGGQGFGHAGHEFIGPTEERGTDLTSARGGEPGVCAVAEAGDGAETEGRGEEGRGFGHGVENFFGGDGSKCDDSTLTHGE